MPSKTSLCKKRLGGATSKWALTITQDRVPVLAFTRFANHSSDSDSYPSLKPQTQTQTQAQAQTHTQTLGPKPRPIPQPWTQTQTQTQIQRPRASPQPQTQVEKPHPDSADLRRQQVASTGADVKGAMSR